MKAQDVSGQKFARLTAVRRTETRNRRTFWLFKCDCGVEKEINLPHVKSGKIRSCGCLLQEFMKSPEHAEFCAMISKKPRTHGMSRTPVHAVWKAMIQRCTNPNAKDYQWYGALGVKVCDAWRKFENFYADMGEPNGLTLDRIDPRKDYEPSNCRWATWDTQRINKRAHHA